MSAPPPKLAIIVLSYNSASYLDGCLEALAKSRDVELEVVCVDNASRDDSHAKAGAHPSTPKAVRSGVNLGYSGGNNLGVRESTGPLLVFINPDCRVLPETLAALVAPLTSEPAVAMCGARLYYPNSRRVQHAGGILHPNAMAEHHGMGQPDDPKWHTDRDVNYVTGALVAMRRADFEALGGFDTDYHPAYYEETDLAWRLRKLGRLIRYAGGAVAYHYESPILEKNSARFVRTSYRSRIRFVIKNYTMGEFLTVFLPFEIAWLRGPFAHGFRLATLRAYGSGLLFALQCVARLSRRPPSSFPKGQT